MPLTFYVEAEPQIFYDRTRAKEHACENQAHSETTHEVAQEPFVCVREARYLGKSFLAPFHWLERGLNKLNSTRSKRKKH